MKSYFFNCSKEYIDKLSSQLFQEISSVINNLPKRLTQREINLDLFKDLIKCDWHFDSIPTGVSNDINYINSLKINNNRDLCLNSIENHVKWRADYAKIFNTNLVQTEAQFGKVELMFKDFCGFEIAFLEQRLSLGIEIVISNPQAYFIHRKASISGMAYFDIAKTVLPLIGFKCPIWIIGIE